MGKYGIKPNSLGGFCSDSTLRARVDRKLVPSYRKWSSMLTRAYSTKYQKGKPTYKDVEVCAEWMDYAVFKNWFDTNYRAYPNEHTELDKDLIKEGNNLYCPEFCRFIPRTLNLLLHDNRSTRGDYPQGVTYCKRDRLFISYLNVRGNQECLGYFRTPEEAYEVYKEAKENHVHKIAEEYKGLVDHDVYLTLKNWQL